MSRHAVVAGAALVLLAAGCGSSSNGAITVSGRVTDFDGQPILSAPVVVFGHPATATDGDGRFSVAGVSVPYDLAVLGGMGNRYAVVYQGLRRADPTVLQEPAVPGAPAPARSATLTGEITPYSSGEVVVAFGSPQTRAAGPSVASCDPAPCRRAYLLAPLSWLGGPPTTTGSLFALQYQVDAGGLPDRFLRWGKYADATGRNQITLADGGTQGADLVLADVGSARLAGSVAVPTGYHVDRKEMAVEWPGGARSSFPDATADLTFDYAAPGLPSGEASISLGARASGPGGWTEVVRTGLAPGARGVVVSIPEPPALRLPVDLAAGIDHGTEFSWTPVPGAIHTCRITVGSGAGSMRIDVFTAGASTRIPDLRAQGLVLPLSVAGRWVVQALGPFASIDELAVPGGLDRPGDRTTGASLVRSFTTR